MMTDVAFDKAVILITGAAGFIGSNLCFYFQEHYPESTVIALDCFRNTEIFSNGHSKSFGHYKNLIGFTGEVMSGDITDPFLMDRLEEEYRFDYIFHQAAISDTTVSEQDVVLKTNVNAFKRLLKMAQRHNADVIYASSAATYGNSSSPQCFGQEAPLNVYGFSKLMMDNMVHQFLKSHPSIAVTGLRYFNVYGPREGYKGKTASTILQFCVQLLQGKRPKLFEGSDTIFRDFIYIEDVLQANIKAAKARRSGVYNVGTGIPRSFEEIVQILMRELEVLKEIEYIKNPYTTHYQFHTQADISSTCKALGYAPKVSLEQGISAYIPWIKHWVCEGEHDAK